MEGKEDGSKDESADDEPPVELLPQVTARLTKVENEKHFEGLLIDRLQRLAMHLMEIGRSDHAFKILETVGRIALRRNHDIHLKNHTKDKKD